MKRNFKNNRKAFTLVELLIVIAIIGILFIVLVSKVDFATDKANATGVQTDFRSFQVAFETVSRENSGFNSLGWDTGDIKRTDFDTALAGYTYENADKDAGDRVRNSYDEGDKNLNGVCEDGETWTGRKIYTETWSGVYTLDNPADATDMSAYLALEKAINKNLDPALHVSIDPENKTIYMANGYQDPWKTEYHGVYVTNADVDGKDRGALIMYSNGPNKVFGSEQTIANGIVSVTVKNNGINGQDDLAIVTCYSYANGYGENLTGTTGFSNNQILLINYNGGKTTINSDEGKTPVEQNKLLKYKFTQDYVFYAGDELSNVSEGSCGANWDTSTGGTQQGTMAFCTDWYVWHDNWKDEGWWETYDYACKVPVQDGTDEDGNPIYKEVDSTCTGSYWVEHWVNYPYQVWYNQWHYKIYEKVTETYEITVDEWHDPTHTKEYDDAIDRARNEGFVLDSTPWYRDPSFCVQIHE